MDPIRDHLFVSYATEDSIFARWLALKLTALGYRVWIDQFELLGGEPYPSRIDEAIKTRTFRFLALLSHSSIHKENPTKERTLALSLGRKRKEDFLIPLNIDGLDATELDWMTSDLTFIPFRDDWAGGLHQLLRKLERLNAPKLATGLGSTAARNALVRPTDVVEEPETLSTNLFPVLSWPEVLHQYQFNRSVTSADLLALSERWTFHFVAPSSHLEPGWAFAFEPPPPRGTGSIRPLSKGGCVWDETESVRGIPVWNLVKPLVRETIYRKCVTMGLEESRDGSYVYFPASLVEKNKIHYRSSGGRRVPVTVTGERLFRGRDRFRYHLGLHFDILRLPGGAPFAKLGIRVRITDVEGEDLPTVSALARRKSLTRNWYNHEFRVRTLAVALFLSDEGADLVCGDTQPLVLASRPLECTADVRIDEASLPKGRTPFWGSRDGDAEPEPEMEVEE